MLLLLCLLVLRHRDECREEGVEENSLESAVGENIGQFSMDVAEYLGLPHKAKLFTYFTGLKAGNPRPGKVNSLIWSLVSHLG